MARVLLTRHATTATTGQRLTGRSPGVHLDEDGRRQAGALADRLAGLDLAAVYTSPLERTRETAHPIADRHGLQPEVVDGLAEVDYGTWTNRTLEELRRQRLWRVVQATPSRATFPDGESLRAVQGRAVEAVETLAWRHREATIVVVSHCDVIKAVVAHFAGMPLDTFQRLVVSTASVTALHLPDAGPPRLLTCNETGSLDHLRDA